ncbi:hypothetical protein FDECE_10925 [Fusarium decemcellulare]|nr:hypothetical protein FDECE_10925 [Fusarium decemcellulare]
MCLPNLFSRNSKQDTHEETTPQPKPAEPTGRRTAEATARLSNSRFSHNGSRRSSSEKYTGYAPGGYAASPSGPDGANGGIYGGVNGGVYSGVSGGPNGGVSGGVYGGVSGTMSGGGLAPAGGYGSSPGGPGFAGAGW